MTSKTKTKANQKNNEQTDDTANEKTTTNNLILNSGPELKTVVERIEKLEDDKADIAADIALEYKGAKDSGYNVKVLRRLIQLRRMDPVERKEQEELLNVYRAHVGLERLPLFDEETGEVKE